MRERILTSDKRQRMYAPRTHGLLLRRGLRRLAGRLLLFGGGRGPAAAARAEPREVVAARPVDGLLVGLELRRFVLEVQLLRVAARDVAGVPRAVDLIVNAVADAPLDHGTCAVFGRRTCLRGLVRTDFAIGVAESSLSVVLIGGFRAKMQRAQPAETRVGNYFAAWTSWASNQCSQTEGLVKRS